MPFEHFNNFRFFIIALDPIELIEGRDCGKVLVNQEIIVGTQPLEKTVICFHVEVILKQAVLNLLREVFSHELQKVCGVEICKGISLIDYRLWDNGNPDWLIQDDFPELSEVLSCVEIVASLPVEFEGNRLTLDGHPLRGDFLIIELLALSELVGPELIPPCLELGARSSQFSVLTAFSEVDLCAHQKVEELGLPFLLSAVA